MAKQNKKTQPEQTEQEQPEVRTGTGETPQDKLQRMKDTNSVCFKHRNDYPRIIEELKKFKYSDVELDYILKPKGQKNIPGFSYPEMERQKQYVNFIESRTPKAEGSHAEAEQARRDEPAEGQSQAF